MAGNTKNLGQVAGVHIGTTPPENTVLIWYDSTTSQKCHKVYDAARRVWVILDQKIISYITYSELVNIAKNVGLSIGKYYQITDKGNTLAIAITTTKVQYNDAIGNILIDDLGTNIQYHVTSSNLSIDDVTGVFDETNKKLVFRFNETVPDFTADDYILGKVQRNNVWSLVKYRLSSFLSKVTGNSITWNGGFYFNFNETLKRQLDKKGGVVSKDSYDRDMEQISTDISNVGKENQNIIKNAQDALDKATAPDQFYATKSPALETGGEPTDAAKGDALLTILSKFQRYITKFKYATGIRVSTDFNTNDISGKVNNNDTVDSALRKLQSQHDSISFALPSNWSPNPDLFEKVNAGDPYSSAIGKIEAWRQPFINLETGWDECNFYSPTQELLGVASYRIRNGILEIVSKNYYRIDIIYNIAVNDYYQNFFFDFDIDFLEKLKPYINDLKNNYGPYEANALQVLGTIVPPRYYNREGQQAIPNFIQTLDYCFSCCNNAGNIATLGISLRSNSISVFTNNVMEIDAPLFQAQTIRNAYNYNAETRKGGIILGMVPFHIRYKLW